MEKETLLEKAKKIIIRESLPKREITDEQIELAIAWAIDEIKLSQFSQVMWGENAHKGVGGKALYTIAVFLRAGIKKGKLKVA